MRFILPVLIIATVAACSPSEPPTEEIVAETPPEPMPELPIRMADDVDMEAIAEDVIGSLNPLENDLRGLEVAVRLRDEFRITQTGVQFELKASGPSGDVKVDELFTMLETSGIESDLLTAEAKDGFYIRTFELEEADKPAISAADAVLQVMKEESPGQNELTFQAIANSCVEPGTMPDQYSVTMYVRSHPNVDFVTLSSELIAERDQTGMAEILFRDCDDT